MRPSVWEVSRKFYDVTIQTTDKCHPDKLFAHKVILASASPFLRKILRHTSHIRSIGSNFIFVVMIKFIHEHIQKSWGERSMENIIGGSIKFKNAVFWSPKHHLNQAPQTRGAKTACSPWEGLMQPSITLPIFQIHAVKPSLLKKIRLFYCNTVDKQKVRLEVRTHDDHTFTPPLLYISMVCTAHSIFP